MVSLQSHQAGLHFKHSFGSKQRKTTKNSNIFYKGGSNDRKRQKLFASSQRDDRKNEN